MNTYIIKKTNSPVTEESFLAANTASISYIPWTQADFPFETEARLLYTDEAIYVNLKTNEWPLTVHHTERDSSVWLDSCMEFFIQPDAEDKNYLNFEMNPVGALVLGYGINRYNRIKPQVDEAVFEIKSIIKNKDWQLFYKIPFSFLREHFKTISPEFYGNLYKCGDEALIPHHFCWNPITDVKDDFHRSEFFGKFVFEEGLSEEN